MVVANNLIPGPDFLIIAGVIVLLFGGRKFPEMMKGIGEGVKEFKKATDGTEEEKKEATPSTENK